MKVSFVRQLHQLIEERNQQYVSEERKDDHSFEGRKKQMHTRRGAQIVKSSVQGDVIRNINYENEQVVDYIQHIEQLIELNGSTYIEEQHQNRRATFRNGELINDVHLEDVGIGNEQKTYDIEEEEPPIYRSPEIRASYDRRKAVQYAERWWDDYNPKYKKFTDNCTNFISQCLHEGGAPMRGYPNRSKGWWFQNDNWSFSWSIANAFRWYLSGSNQGLRGEERESATDLEPGDVICYDFDGDGKWQHSTIVVAKDSNGEPLVNAQTSNSRMRYWKYEDSTAWTPNIKYKFFHIVVE